ncbi:MAG: DUF2461 domain-containing protein [Acidobacteriota bacterium]|nr:DUF2461 domain-containing protein [Acidobacteriota bacterium]
MKAGFAGFRPEAMKFLRGLKKNNDREWFQPRKELFENELKAPMIELVAALQREIEATAPEYTQDPAKGVYRIYRDTRFSKNKTPYKTHLSACLKQRDLGREGSAVFYFHVSPDEIVIAAGNYMPGANELRSLRNHMSEHYAEFAKLARAPKLRAALGELKGEQLTRVPKGFDPEHPAADLLRRKQLYFERDLPPALATGPELHKELSQALKAAIPVLKFLNAPLAGLAKADEGRYLREPG